MGIALLCSTLFDSVIVHIDIMIKCLNRLVVVTSYAHRMAALY